MILAAFRARRARKALIAEIRGEIVAAARRPALYGAYAAPDSVDGRFELLILHSGLVLRRLAAIGGLGAEIAQALVDSLFEHFDDTLREMALGDIAVNKRLKKMAAAFYGRLQAYDAALDSGSREPLAAALARNVWGAESAEAAPQARSLADHVAMLETAFAAIPLEDFAQGRFRYPAGAAPAAEEARP